MTDIESTRDMLARHHRDGPHFANLMKETFPERFGEGFWSAWDRAVGPVLSDPPVIVDLGAGPGLFLQEVARRYPGARAFGVECAPYMIEAADPLPEGCAFIEADLHDPRLPLDDDSVDAALASVVLHEMSQPVKTLIEIRRCLKPGGRIYILDWVRTPLAEYIRNETDDEGEIFDPATPAERLDDLFTHFIEHNRFSREDLIYMMEKSGFRILESELLKGGRFARLIGVKR